MDTASRPISVNGNDGLINDYNQWLLVTFPKLNLQVSILYWTDHALADRILNTMHAA